MPRPAHACLLGMMILALALTGCGADPGTPEEQIRAHIDTAARAAEARDVGALGAMLAADYSDSRGYDRRAVLALVRLYLLRNQNVHLYTLIQAIQVPAKDRASARVLAAMAAQPVAEAEQLLNIRADLLAFDVDFVFTDGEWKVIGATWARAGVDDFLPGQF